MGWLNKDKKEEKDRAYDLHDLVLCVGSAIAESKSDIDFLLQKDSSKK